MGIMSHVHELNDEIDRLKGEVEEFQEALGAYVMPTLVMVRCLNPTAQQDDLIANVQKKLIPFTRDTSEPHPKGRPPCKDRKKG